MWGFKQIKDLYPRTVVPPNLFIKFIHAKRDPREVFAVC